LPPITPELVIAIAVFLLVAFPVHEFSHALVAYRLGDSTARLFGRLTLNPIVHFDPLGGALLVISMLVSGGQFGFGWAKPTPVNPMNLHGGRRGEALVALAGPASNLVMAAIAAIPIRILLAVGPDTSATESILNVLAIFLQLNLIIGLFNLVPIPPLDGYRILLGLIDPRTAWQIRPILDQYGFYILLAVFFFPILPGGQTIGSQVLIPVVHGIFSFLVGV
jgi:Zn-dependent protease